MTLNIIQGKVFGQARNVRTKYGERSVVDVTLADGTTRAIWKAAGDQSIARLTDGERVTLTIDNKGNIQEVEGSFDRAQAQRVAAARIAPTIESQPARSMGFAVTLPMEAERQLSRQLAAAQPVAIEHFPMAESGSSIDGRIAELGRVYSQCLAAAGGSEAVAIEIFKVATNA
jgi:hypothetical protein